MDIFLARQPILDIDQNLCAYEILYRSGNVNEFDGSEGDKASTQVIVNTFQNFGIDSLTNGKPVFINFTENLIFDEIATLFPKELLIVEILEDVKPSLDIIERLKGLKDQGYRIALDDFLNREDYGPLVELADIIKVDFMEMERGEIEEILRAFKDYKLEFLAEKVETREEFEYAKELGFKYFQGYFFSKPEIVKTKKILPIKANYLQLVNEINKKDTDFERISKIISRDLSLTYNLLKLVNSSAFGFRYRIKGVKHALAALGERQLRNWIYLLILNDMGEHKPDQLTRLSLVRAKFMELLAMETKYSSYAQDMFLLGLFSLLDVILEKPLEEALKEISTSDMVREALLYGRGEGEILYKTILSYEKGQWDQVLIYMEKLNISRRVIIKSYIKALKWYTEIEA